jgi:hypothetical protein
VARDRRWGTSAVAEVDHRWVMRAEDSVHRTRRPRGQARKGPPWVMLLDRMSPLVRLVAAALVRLAAGQTLEREQDRARPA